jgi:BMFP domain-containing protein YqiC
MNFGNNTFFSDLARLAGGAGNAAMQYGRELESYIHEKMEQWAARMKLVTREEFEVVREMASKAREENETLKKRFETLETKQSK